MNPRLASSLYFSVQRAAGSHVHDYYREFLQFQSVPAAEMSAIADQRLAAILTHAAGAVPYYQERVSVRRDPAPGDFPVLTKGAIRENFHSLMTPSFRRAYERGVPRRYAWTTVKTGGSTGAPTTVIHDPEYRDRGRAARLYSQYLCGFPVGEPYFRLWGNMREINHMQDSLPHRILSRLANERLLNAFRMNDRQAESYLRQINDSCIAHVMAYTDAIHHLAQYASNRDIPVRPLKSIMGCGGTVTKEVRQAVGETFQCRLHNKYGSRECADMACECAHGGIHIYSNNVFLEVVNAAGLPVAPGHRGRILVTLLSNKSFPLIRYEIGDVGTLAGKACACGVPFPCLQEIEGRNIEFLFSNDGGYVSPIYIRHLIGVVHNSGLVRKFQIVQNSLTDFELKVELDAGASRDSAAVFAANVERDLKAVLGRASQLTISWVEQIESAPSGKFLYAVNRVKGYGE